MRSSRFSVRPVAMLGLAFSLSAATPALAAAPDAVRAYATSHLDAFIDTSGCPVVERPPWPSGLIRRCVYTVTDKQPTAGHKLSYTAVVWLADPTIGRIAEWAWSACQKARPDQPEACAVVVIDQIREVSSAGHFPVAGLYYEDICDPTLPKGHRCEGQGDGRFEAWMFRDGVTSRLEGFSKVNGSTWPDGGGDVGVLSEQVAAAKLAGLPTGKLRPVSLLPSEFISVAKPAGLVADVSSPKTAEAWLKLVRDLYAPALEGPEAGSENPFVTAWACVHQSADPSACYAKSANLR